MKHKLLLVLLYKSSDEEEEEENGNRGREGKRMQTEEEGGVGEAEEELKVINSAPILRDRKRMNASVAGAGREFSRKNISYVCEKTCCMKR